MEAIIHPGMPKTGSSSIQATLVAVQPEGWVLPDTPTGNMSGQYSLFFEDNPQEHRSFKARGLTADDAFRERKAGLEKFESRLREGAVNGMNALFTGERISGASEIAAQRLADLYRSHGYKIRVVAYVRKPLSFIQSAFQQNIKVKKVSLNKKSIQWPKYRERFEKFDLIFGRENVQLSLFDPENLEGGDVCLDFFKRIGLKISSEQVVRVNESMSLAACALLYAQRNFGEGVVHGFRGAQVKNKAFVATLSRIPGKPIKFKRSLVEPMFEASREDLEWMEERLGVSLSDLPDEDSPDATGGAEDLLSVAENHREELEGLLFAAIKQQQDQPRDRLIRNLELLRKLHY